MRYALVLLLAGPVLAGDPTAARATMEAQLKSGDELRAKGDLDGAIAVYRKALVTFREALAKEEGKAAEGEKPPEAPEAAPADDGTPEGRKRVIDYYTKLLGHKSDEVRYNAVAQLGEMRAVEARDAFVLVLAKDTYQVARRAAAWSLGRLGKDAVPAIPALVREVGGEFPLLGHMCDDALGKIAEAVLGQAVAMGFKAEMTPAERLEVQKKWQAWFDENRGKLGIPDEKVEEEPAAEPEKK
jgi:HEAT repeats